MIGPAIDESRTPRLATSTTMQSHPAARRGSSGGVEADPGLVGQDGDPLGSQHRRELAQHAWQLPGRHNRHTPDDHLAPGDLGAMDSHDRHHHHVGVSHNQGGLIRLERHRAQGGGEG